MVLWPILFPSCVFILYLFARLHYFAVFFGITFPTSRILCFLGQMFVRHHVVWTARSNPWANLEQMCEKQEDGSNIPLHCGGGCSRLEGIWIVFTTEDHKLRVPFVFALSHFQEISIIEMQGLFVHATDRHPSPPPEPRVSTSVCRARGIMSDCPPPAPHSIWGWATRRPSGCSPPPRPLPRKARAPACPARTLGGE